MRKLRELKKSIKVNTSFENLLTEATKKDISYKLLIVSGEPENHEYFHTAQRLKDEAESMNIPTYVLFAGKGSIQLESRNPTTYKIYNEDDSKGFEIEPKNTVAIIRGSVIDHDSRLDLVSQLEKAGVCCVNPRQTIQICSDKYWTGLRLADVGLTTPKTALIQDEDTIPKALEIVGEKYPLILKTLRGSKGVGVLFIESRRSLDSTCQLLWKINKDTELLLQSYIKAPFDVRVHILGDTVLASMRRDVAEGDFRSNYSQGAKVKSYKLSEDEKLICLKAAKAVGGVWTAVDFIKNKDEVFILEVNNSPGTEGIEKATKENILRNILEYFKDKSKWSRTPTPCGYYETVDIKPFGTLVAKFDTGNVRKSVIHAENVKIKDDKVTFTCNGKTITTKLEGVYSSMTGAGPEERHFIKQNITFLGHTYIDVEFGLDDRSHFDTDVLLNRRLMNAFNVMVNPSKKFLITTYKEIK
jgi:ribosomal protein S6--L-glutamate ligase